MKALLLNGSPRKGNTHTALKALKKGFENISGLEIEEIAAADAAITPCLACKSCRDSGLCIFDDDTNSLLDAVAASDVIVFATPVYWWGMTAQLKTMIDKFYARIEELSARKKQVGVIIVGQLSTDNPQYELISRQFACISDYLGWTLSFCSAHSAYDASDLEKNPKALTEIEALWKTIKQE